MSLVRKGDNIKEMARTYSEDEAARLLKKAAKLQDATASSLAGGVTQDELRRIAQEAGIDPRFLELAETQPESSRNQLFFGFGEEVVYELPYELSADAERHFFDELSASVKISQSTTVGSTKRMHVGRGLLFGNLEVTSRLGKTTVRLRQSPFVAYFAGLHGPLILGCILTLALGARGNLVGSMAGLVTILVGFAIFWFLSQGGRRTAESKWQEIVELLDRTTAADPNLAKLAAKSDASQELRLQA